MKKIILIKLLILSLATYAHAETAKDVNPVAKPEETKVQDDICQDLSHSEFQSDLHQNSDLSKSISNCLAPTEDKDLDSLALKK